MAGHDHDHDHHHDHDHSELSETQLRVRALETVLTEKGYVDPAALDAIDRDLRDQDRPAQRRARRRQGLDRSGLSRAAAEGRDPAIAELGYAGRQGEHIVALENTPKLHNMVVCTLCSCYPWPVLGLPPVWYKSAPYRSRAVTDPRGVLADFGVDAAEGHRDPRLGFDRRDALSRAADAAGRHRRLERGEARRPRHARLHDRHRAAEASSGCEMNGVQDLGGMHGFGPVEPEPNEPVFHAEWEKRAFALTLAMGMPGGWNIDMSRFARENRPPGEYLAMSYYQIWFAGAGNDAEGARARRPKTRSRPAIPASAEAGQARAVARRRAEDAASRRADRARDQHRAAFKPGDACARRTSIRRPTRGCRAMCAAIVGTDRARDRLSRFSRQQRNRRRRKPAMALHRALRRARTVGTGWRSDHRRCRSTPGSLTSSRRSLGYTYSHAARSRPCTTTIMAPSCPRCSCARARWKRS